ncbi:hypothetical protein EI983_02280 [Roseovarius faecimaris]|uniref:Protein ImuA n=1 Tax=Roseovarius faecimaris TaxID=2494550 RepID=A0A6I6IX06_9RHOB|nr:hypothetical protein [Roseovarius faecimaris]QGX97168.1 hypothetical protein EI983_02280 [Roseovarius faecimaris]
MTRPDPHITLLPGAPLRLARCHEAEGPGATGFALALAAMLDGPLLWIAQSWTPEQLNPVGISRYIDPARLLLVTPKDQDDALAVAEDALRAGAVRLVIVEVTKPLSLLAGRRLQLAAEAGRTTALCLIPEGAGSNAADTRWHCAPVFDPADSTHARWEIIKNKKGTLAAFTVHWDEQTRRISLVSPPGQ